MKGLSFYERPFSEAKAQKNRVKIQSPLVTVYLYCTFKKGEKCKMK